MALTLRKKFTIIQILLLFFVTVSASLIVTYELQQYYKTVILSQLQTQIEQVEYLLADTTLSSGCTKKVYELLNGFAQAAHIRLTLIDSAGTVIFDSNVPQDSLTFVENHLHRPEVQMAIKKGFGSDQRLSATIHKDFYYAAQVIKPSGSHAGFHYRARFLRLAIPLVEVNRVLRVLRWKIFAGGGIALVLIALLSYWTSDKLTHPIQKLTRVAESVKMGNLEAHFKSSSRDEIGKLADLLNEMLDKLRDDLVQVRRLEKVRSQFLGNVSHELRTPIFAVQGYLETLLEAKISDAKTQKDFIAKAYHQAVRLNNLLTDLIDISRIESGEMKLSFHDFDVRQWLVKQVEDMQGKAQESGIAVIFRTDDRQPNVIVIGDQERLTQVIVNIVENAIKYNVPGGKVEIGYRINSKEAEISVSDTGRGIPAEHIPRIFERFYRVDKERSRAVGGTGLGLAIVKHIVEAHGSRVKVESEIGKGSIFSFNLKRKV